LVARQGLLSHPALQAAINEVRWRREAWQCHAICG
jgi:hypothetical protein